MIWLLALQLAMTPQQYYDSAMHALSRMTFRQAEQEIDAALHKDPYFVSALILKANLALFAHQPDVARNCLITAVVGHPSSAEAQLSLGVFYYGQGNFKLAIPPLLGAHSLSPQDAKSLLYLAMSYEAMSDFSEALPLYQQAEHLSAPSTPQAAAALTAYGRVLSSLSKYKESTDKEQLAVIVDRQSRDAHYELAKALDLEYSYKNAAAEGELALTLPGSEITDTQIHLLLGEVYLQLKDYDLARVHLAKLPLTAHLISQ